jgi:hypothetical protein
MNCIKNVDESSRGRILNFYPGICLEGLRNTTGKLNHDSWFTGRDLKPGPPKYESGMLTSRTRRSVVLLLLPPSQIAPLSTVASHSQCRQTRITHYAPQALCLGPTCLGPTKEWKGEKIKIKKWKVGNVIQNKIQDFTSMIFFQKRKFHYKPTYEVGSVWQEHISQSESS